MPVLSSELRVHAGAAVSAAGLLGIHVPGNAKKISILQSMKAKEMAERYQAEPTVKTLTSLAGECIKEVKTMAEARGVRDDNPMRQVIREVDDKWRAFARLCPDVAPGGFKAALHAIVPISKELFP